MKLLDANLLLYAFHPESQFHQRAKDWLTQTLSAPDFVYLSWHGIVAFIRISTQANLFQNPLTIDECNQIVAGWIARENVWIAEPGPGHWEVFNKVLKDGQCRGKVVTDAHLAALAIENGLTLYTLDRGFSRFEGLSVVNPLA